MFVLLLIAAFFESYGISVPIANVIDPLQQPQSGSVIVPNHKMRTTSDIVWSCISTLFICTWVAIHPNIPPREGAIRSLWRRVKLMLWTLLVPELILMWAYKQWAGARHIAEYFKDENWTLMHGHFLIMGGFIYIDEGRESVLDFNSFHQLLGLEIVDRYGDPIYHRLVGRISFPIIIAEEICDKARGDFLSKAIVILQSLWFITQCIAHHKEGLALTELELVTLALASLTGVMYFFWWDKPLGIKEPIKIYREGQEPPKRVIEGGRSEDERRHQHIKDSKCRLVQKVIVCSLQMLQSSLLQFLNNSHTMLSSYYKRLFCVSSSISNINQFLIDQRDELDELIPAVNYLWVLYLPLYWIIWIPFMSLFKALGAIADSDEFRSTKSRIPAFYAPWLTYSITTQTLLLFVLPPIAVIFGALHCVAWNFYFPSHIEQLLWRIGSLTITLIPFVPALYYLVVGLPLLLMESLEKLFNLALPSISVPEIMGNVLAVIFGFLAGTGLVAYMLARLLLLSLAIVSLRKQPDSAFYAIDWFNFLPHI